MDLFSPLILVLSWVFVCFALSRAGGWRLLAGHYRTRERFKGERVWMQTLRMRWMVNYGNCVNFGVNARGLHVSMFLIFRLFHPPLFIPWSELRATHERDPLSAGFTVLHASAVPGVGLYLSEGLARALQKAAEEAWPESGAAEAQPQAQDAPTETGRTGSPFESSATESLKQTEKQRKAAMKAELDRLMKRH